MEVICATLKVCPHSYSQLTMHVRAHKHTHTQTEPVCNAQLLNILDHLNRQQILTGHSTQALEELWRLICLHVLMLE